MTDAIDRLVNPQRRKTSLVEIAQPQLTQSLPQADIVVSNLRIEKPIADAILQHCKVSGFSRDAFIEAVWLMMESDPQLLQAVDKKALERHSKRRKQGVMKRAKTMLTNLESPS